MGEERSKSPRRWGDRRDGRWVKAPGLQTIMSYLMPKRTDCEVYLHDTIDATELTAWLAERNALHPEYKTTVFHCFVTVMARMVRERPKMNRFIQGWRMFERDEVSLSFVAKRRFADGADELAAEGLSARFEVLDILCTCYPEIDAFFHNRNIL